VRNNLWASLNLLEGSCILSWVLDEGEVGSGFAEMEDDAPVQVEPAEMCLEYGAICRVDAICEGGYKYGEDIIDDEAGHRDAQMVEHFGSWIEMDRVTCGLDRSLDQIFPGGLPITEADFVQAFANSLNDSCSQRGLGDEFRWLGSGEIRQMRTIQQPLPNQALLAEVHQETGAKSPEFAVAEYLNQMFCGE